MEGTLRIAHTRQIQVRSCEAVERRRCWCSGGGGAASAGVVVEEEAVKEEVGEERERVILGEDLRNPPQYSDWETRARSSCLEWRWGLRWSM